MKKINTLILALMTTFAWSEMTENPDVVVPIEIISRSWIDSSDIRTNFIPPLFGLERRDYLTLVQIPLQLDPSVSNDNNGFAKDLKYRLWIKYVLEARVKEGQLTVKYISSDKDGGLEAGGFLSGTVNLVEDPPELKKEGDKYTFQYLCYGMPAPFAAQQLKRVRHRTSENIWHRVKGEISLEGGEVKTVVKFNRTSKFPSHVLYLNTKIVEEVKQGFISDLWLPEPGFETFVIGN